MLNCRPNGRRRRRRPSKRLIDETETGLVRTNSWRFMVVMVMMIMIIMMVSCLSYTCWGHVTVFEQQRLYDRVRWGFRKWLSWLASKCFSTFTCRLKKYEKLWSIISRILVSRLNIKMLNLPVDLYGCETLWSEFKVFKKTKSRRMFGSTVETEPRKWREVLNKNVLKSRIWTGA